MDPGPLPSTVLIAGCGDIGVRAGLLLHAMGREVTGLVRTEQSARTLREAGIRPWVAELDGGAIPEAGQALVLYLAPPPATGTADSRLRHFLACLSATPRRLVYVSTSGVYGDCQGRWIDEDEPLKPQTGRAQRRLDAELALAEYAQRGMQTVILRVPGIYGPGRLPLERLQQGLPVIRPDESPYSNRIHADDLAHALLQAAAFGRPGAAYNISDGHPSTMADYFSRCARLLGLPEPPQVSLPEARKVFTPAMWSFVGESKRLLTDRARDQLRFTPRYPDLASGLPGCLPAAATIGRVAGIRGGDQQ